jgi:hypothetical protein
MQALVNNPELVALFIAAIISIICFIASFQTEKN